MARTARVRDQVTGKVMVLRTVDAKEAVRVEPKRYTILDALLPRVPGPVKVATTTMGKIIEEEGASPAASVVTEGEGDGADDEPFDEAVRRAELRILAADDLRAVADAHGIVYKNRATAVVDILELESGRTQP